MTEHNNVIISRELLRQVLDALREIAWSNDSKWQSDRAQGMTEHLRTALEQPAREPVVAWIKTSDQYPPAGVRVFWFNPQYNQVGYDTWLGEDYKFNAEYWMRIPDIAPQAQQEKP